MLNQRRRPLNDRHILREGATSQIYCQKASCINKDEKKTHTVSISGSNIGTFSMLCVLLQKVRLESYIFR